ncbi:hypothetical protein [Streptomyces noursei]|nr:hypothetical protein [Streptomyces noursei]
MAPRLVHEPWKLPAADRADPDPSDRP